MGISSYFRRLLGGGGAEMRHDSVQCIGPHGLHRMAYVEWGDPRSPHVVVCVHGLTRNGRDFDYLARALAGRCRVVCPDVVGRGRSDRLTVADDYALPLYLADMVTLIARLGVTRVDWVGTSMGGLIGMMLAAQERTPIRRMVLNDVGPVITAEALRRIGEYVGKAPLFDSYEEAERYVRVVNAPFGRLDDAQWRHMIEHGTRRRDDGRFEFVYDPAIAEPFRKALIYGDVNLWTVYDAIRCPVLTLRGTLSDVLTAATFAEMMQRGPHSRTLEFAAVGHAPALMDAEQIGAVGKFLLELPGESGR